MENFKQTLEFYCKNEIARFQLSEYYFQLCFLANKLNYTVKCSYGYGLNDNGKMYLDFSIRNSNDEIVYVNDLDYEHLCDATCIIEIDKKQRCKFYSWENDDEFKESILWTLNELKFKFENLLK